MDISKSIQGMMAAFRPVKAMTIAVWNAMPIGDPMKIETPEEIVIYISPESYNAVRASLEAESPLTYDVLIAMRRTFAGSPVVFMAHHTAEADRLRELFIDKLSTLAPVGKTEGAAL